MSTTRLLIAALVLAGLGGAIWWSNKQEEAKKDKPDPKAPPKILTLKEADLSKIELERKGETPTLLTRDDQGKWSIIAPEALAADGQPVSAITSATANLSSDRVVDEKATNLSAYGLEPPAISVKLTMKDGSTHRLRVGEETADKSGVYAAVDGDPRLYTMPSYSKATFDKKIADLRDKHLVKFESNRISRLELNVTGKPGIEFGKTAESQWQILKPQPMRADSLQVDELIRTLKDAEMDVSVDSKQAASAFATAKPVATVRATAPSYTETFEVRRAANDYYARSTSVAGTYKITETVGKGVDKALADFENKKLFDFGFNDPNKIEYKYKDGKKSFEKNEEKWLLNGRTMDSVAVQNLVDKLRDLTATRIDDTKPGPSDTEITVVSDTGARTETIFISPAGSDFLARRDKESVSYRLDASAVSGVRDAVGGVKEAAPEPAKSDDKNKK
jgi:hypothetical protein